MLLLLTPLCARAEQAVILFQTPDTKEANAVTIELFPQDAPQTVANFVKLVRSGFYKGIVVHRTVADTLVGAGDPLSKKKDRTAVGTGGPGYTLPAEINKHKHIRGAVAMAGLPTAINPARASNGSQFYIVLRPQPQLDKEYTVFGQVVGGLEFLDSLSRRGADSNDYPQERIVIRSIEIKP
ncbi:MAG: peptidylprolyl isomerase [Verrucomicrobia bacterium]|nr:peptidylprolyl isomerase [Verrucomicrobiota bacterium]